MLQTEVVTNEKAPLDERSAFENSQIETSNSLTEATTKTDGTPLNIHCLKRWFNHVDIDKFRRTDVGNANFLATLLNRVVRYNANAKSWMIWRGHYWGEDHTGEIMTLAQYATEMRISHVQDLRRYDGDDISKNRHRDDAISYAFQCQSLRNLNATLTLAECDPRIATRERDWNAKPHLVALENGVFDLEIGCFRAGKPEEMISRALPVNYKVGANCPLFEKFFNEILPEPEVRHYVHKALGYSIGGDIEEQTMFLCLGEGSNGKSTLLSTITSLLGSYAWQLNLLFFDASNKAPIPNDVAVLAGKRFVVGSEVQEGSSFNEAKVKMLTGERHVTARFLNKEFGTFTNQTSIWLSLNDLPRVHDNSYGCWRRLKVIPFSRVFRKEEIDPKLEEKFVAEYSGIFNWLVRGYKLWRNEGLMPPAALVSRMRQYQEENDQVGNFLNDCCVIDEGEKIKLSRLWAAFQGWIEQSGEKKTFNKAAFNKYLEKRNCVRRKFGKDSQWHWFGLNLISDPGDPLSTL